MKNGKTTWVFLYSEKATLGFRIYKIWQILQRFAGTFCRARTLKLGGVNTFRSNLIIKQIQNHQNCKAAWETSKSISLTNSKPFQNCSIRNHFEKRLTFAIQAISATPQNLTFSDLKSTTLCFSKIEK